MLLRPTKICVAVATGDSACENLAFFVWAALLPELLFRKK